MTIAKVLHHNPMKNKGFTLIEVGMIVMIIGILATISLPLYTDQLTKSKLAELEVRIDAMRTAAKVAYEEGDRSFLAINNPQPGIIPPELQSTAIEDSMTYPNFNLMFLSTAMQFGQFGGSNRLYLVVGASNNEGIRQLKLLSQILPDKLWAWWAPSTVMVISLIDDIPAYAVPPMASVNTPTNNLVPTAIPQKQPQATPSQIPQQVPTPLPQSTPKITEPQTGTSQSSTSQYSTVTNNNECVHPGNGHAYGRCGNHPNHGNHGNHGNKH